jgi:hypothetical protein
MDIILPDNYPLPLPVGLFIKQPSQQPTSAAECWREVTNNSCQKKYGSYIRIYF